MTPNEIRAFDKWAESGLGKLEFFRPHEFRFLGGSHYDTRSKAHGLNTLPPKEMWPRMMIPALAADAAREQHGSPIRILSAYRSPAYNKAIKGAKFSRHLEFDALDLMPSDGRVDRLVHILKRLRKQGFFAGGLGIYPSFVHIDNRGTNVDF